MTFHKAMGLALVSMAMLVPALAQTGDKVVQSAPAGQTKPDKKAAQKAKDKAKAGQDSRAAKPAASDLHVVPATKSDQTGATTAPGQSQNPQTGTPTQPGAGQTPGGQPAGPGQPNVGGPGRRGGRGDFTFPSGGFGGGQGGGPSPGGMVSMDFRGSDIQSVLKFFAMATGWQIVPDPTLTGTVTIVSPRQLTISQAYEVLQSVLEIRGFQAQLEKRGTVNVLKIAPLDTVAKSTKYLVGPNGKPDTSGLTPDQLKNQVVTEVIPVDTVDAKALQTELKDLINKGASIIASAGSNALIVTDTASNVDRVKALVEMLDKASSANTVRMVPLHHSDATDVAKAINDLFGKVFSRGQPGAPQQPGQPPPINPATGQPMPGGAGQSRSAVVAVADTRTNSVLLVASEENLKRVEELIKQLDDPEASALKTYLHKMEYADALDVADTINSILSGLGSPRPGSTQGASFNQRVFGFGGGGFGGFGGGGGGQNQQAGSVASTDPFAKVVGNARTNSLIITATKEKYETIKDLIAQLDVPVKTETTTFVETLKYAQAQDIAYILNQAFMSSTGNNQNGFGGFFGFGGFGGAGGQGQQRQPIQRRQGAQSNSSPFGRSAPLRGGPNAEEDQGQGQGQDTVHGTLTPNGFVPDGSAGNEPTRAAAAGGGGQFFGGGGFGGRNRMMDTPQFGRGIGGNYVNYLQLQYRVNVVADPGTNSLIITTVPDNMTAIREILAQLDVTPMQVLIDVIIAEASVDSTSKLGFQFDANGVGKFLGMQSSTSGSSNFPLGTAGTTVNNIGTILNPGAQFGIQAANGKFSALVQALNSDNRIRILSTPKVFTSNLQAAEIDVTTQIQVPNGSFSGGFGGGTTIGYQPQNVGITLNVTPRITKDGQVTIDVVAESSDLAGFDNLTTSIDANGRVTTVQSPRIATRRADTSVSVHDGDVVALGGLMRETSSTTVNKIPILGDIPLIGNLFRSQARTTAKTELMLFMIPHVVLNKKQADATTQKEAAPIIKQFPQLKKDQPGLVGPPIDLNNVPPANAPEKKKEKP